MSQPVRTHSATTGTISQLTQLLTQLNALQRLFTAFTSCSSPAVATPPPVNQLLSQLLLPQNQAALISWLKQGAGKQALGQLLQQSTQADSPLNQWLQALPEDKQKEFKALLKMVAEQRVAQAMPEQPASHSGRDPVLRDNEPSLLQLQLLQPNGREMSLSVQQDSSAGSNKKANRKPQWRVNLALPVGDYETVYAAALWDQHTLSLCFEAENPSLLRRTENLVPLLTARLAMLGIRSEPASFNIRPQESHQPMVDGFSIMV